MIDILVNLLVDFVGQVSCLLLCTAFLKRKCSAVKWSASFIFTLAFGFIITSATTLNRFPIKALFLIAAFSVFCHICYTGSILVHLLCALFSYAVMLCIDTATIFIFVNLVGCSRQQLFGDSNLSIRSMIFSHTIILVICFSVWRGSRAFKKINSISIENWLTMQIFPIISLLTMAILFQSTVHDTIISKWVIIDVCALILANIVLMFLLYRVEQENQTRKENALLQNELRSQIKAANALISSQKMQRQMTHDFKHHLTAIENLLVNGEMSKCKEYIKELTNTGCANSSIVNTNNPIIDAVLNQKYCVACEKGIDMEFAINDLSCIPLTDEECVVVLSNLIDNAIEACEVLSPNRVICIKFLCCPKQTILVVKNTTSLDIGTINKPLSTSKNSALWHGYGLKNVFAIFQKHGAFPVIRCSNGWFNFAVSFHRD